MKSIGEKLVIEALNDSYYPDLNQSVNAETMVNVINNDNTIKQSERIVDFLNNLRDYLNDAFQDNYSHSYGHSTQSYCLLCGGKGEHPEDCPRIELDDILKEIK